MLRALAEQIGHYIPEDLPELDLPHYIIGGGIVQAIASLNARSAPAAPLNMDYLPAAPVMTIPISLIFVADRLP